MILRTRQQVGVAVLTLLGRVFMPPVDCPFQAADRVLAALPADVRVILVDFHAEATSDKQLMGRHLDGRVSAVLGTHTHVATADEQILPGGTAFQCDVGMTGPHESILGRRIDRVMETDPHLSAHPLRRGHGRRAPQRQRSSTSIRRPAGPPRSAGIRSIRPPPSCSKGEGGRRKGDKVGGGDRGLAASAASRRSAAAHHFPTGCNEPSASSTRLRPAGGEKSTVALRVGPAAAQGDDLPQAEGGMEHPEPLAKRIGRRRAAAIQQRGGRGQADVRKRSVGLGNAPRLRSRGEIGSGGC